MKKRRVITSSIVYIILFVGAAFFLLPFAWMVRSSLMNMSQIFLLPPLWVPNPVEFHNFADAMSILPFGKYFYNTMVILVFSIIGIAVTSSISAYSFSRLQWRGRDLTFGIILTSMMLPHAVTLIPTFMIWKYVGLLNTFYPLIIPAWLGGGAFNIFLLRQFYLTVPKELDDAALVDGAGYVRIFIQIILPLTVPAMIVVLLFAFLHYWNDFLSPLIYLNDTKKYTLALGLQQFIGQYNAQWDLMMAAATVIILPAILVFILGQKYFIQGIATTGLKG